METDCADPMATTNSTSSGCVPSSSSTFPVPDTAPSVMQSIGMLMDAGRLLNVAVSHGPTNEEEQTQVHVVHDDDDDDEEKSDKRQEGVEEEDVEKRMLTHGQPDEVTEHGNGFSLMFAAACNGSTPNNKRKQCSPRCSDTTTASAVAGQPATTLRHQRHRSRSRSGDGSHSSSNSRSSSPAAHSSSHQLMMVAEPIAVAHSNCEAVDIEPSGHHHHRLRTDASASLAAALLPNGVGSRHASLPDSAPTFHPQARMEFACNAFTAVQELLHVYGLSISPADIVNAFRRQASGSSAATADGNGKCFIC